MSFFVSFNKFECLQLVWVRSQFGVYIQQKTRSVNKMVNRNGDVWSDWCPRLKTINISNINNFLFNNGKCLSSIFKYAPIAPLINVSILQLSILSQDLRLIDSSRRVFTSHSAVFNCLCSIYQMLNAILLITDSGQFSDEFFNLSRYIT